MRHNDVIPFVPVFGKKAPPERASLPNTLEGEIRFTLEVSRAEGLDIDQTTAGIMDAIASYHSDGVSGAQDMEGAGR